MLITGINAAQIDAGPVRDVVISDGMVIAGAPTTGRRLDAAGRVVLPAFVDAHVHLDKAFLQRRLEAEGRTPSARLPDAIAAVDALRQHVGIDDLRANAVRAVDAMVAHGTVAARVHVEIGAASGRQLTDLHLELVEAVRERCHLQLVAFPQLGLDAPGALSALQAATGAGLDLVGGCPYVDTDPKAHLDEVFALAERRGCGIDLHLDFDDDPSGSLLGAVVERTIAHGMQGQVTIGHATTLAAMAPSAQAGALDDLAAAEIGLIVLPFSDLHLAGHGEPGTRSMAPVRRAHDAGVNVAAATNNIENPFAPSGNGSVLLAAWAAGLVQRASGPDDRAVLLDAITSTPARLLGLPAHGPAPGQRADLVVVDHDDPATVISAAPPVVATIRSGHIVMRARRPALTGEG